MSIKRLESISTAAVYDEKLSQLQARLVEEAKGMKTKKGIKCINCAAANQKLLVCLACFETFCKVCCKHYYEGLRLNRKKTVKRTGKKARKAKGPRCALCYGCKNRILIENGLEDFSWKKRKLLNYNEALNAINEPTWVLDESVEYCFSCLKKFGRLKFTCSSCAECFCSSCSLVYSGEESIFKYPFSTCFSTFA